MAQEQKQAAEQGGLQPTGTPKRKWESATLSLDDEVRAALKRGAAVHGSPNKALRAVLLLIWGEQAPTAATITAAFTSADVGQPLSAGNLVDAGVLPDGRHYAVYNPATFSRQMPEPDVTAFEEEPADGHALEHILDTGHPPAPDTRPKNATCKHCGNRFAGPKYATICPQCQIDGHRTGDCAECRLNQGGA